jgi:hypothetical protein
MKRALFLQILICFASSSFAQFRNSFPFGGITAEEVEMKSYEKDTSAHAVVLNEFGEAYIDSDGENNLLLEYHVKMKILTKQGLDQANFEINLQKGERGKQTIRSVEAVTYNVVNNRVKETPMKPNQVFTTSVNQYWDEYKFTMPDAIYPGVSFHL